MRPATTQVSRIASSNVNHVWYNFHGLTFAFALSAFNWEAFHSKNAQTFGLVSRYERQKLNYYTCSRQNLLTHPTLSFNVDVSLQFPFLCSVNCSMKWNTSLQPPHTRTSVWVISVCASVEYKFCQLFQLLSIKYLILLFINSGCLPISDGSTSRPMLQQPF